jgi:hypothetical protein
MTDTDALESYTGRDSGEVMFTYPDSNSPHQFHQTGAMVVFEIIVMDAPGYSCT